MSIRLAAATLNQTPLDWSGNLHRIRQALELARENRVDLLCLPELCITSYSCMDMFLAPWLAERSLECLKELLPHTKGLATGLGFPYWHKGYLYNCQAFVHDGRVLGISAKQNLPGDGVYYEPRWFKAWKGGTRDEIMLEDVKVPFGDIVYELFGKKIAFEICEDAWRKQRPALKYVDEGVDVILNPSASHYEFGKTRIREDLMKESSRSFNCIYIYANQSGNEAGRLIYEGDLIIADRGSILRRNDHLRFREVHLEFTDIGPGDERPPSLEDLGPPDLNREFRRAASVALYDYMRKSRSRGFTVSLSGGADSSCCALLVAEMVKLGIAELGEEDFLRKCGREDLAGRGTREITEGMLTCVYQGTENSSATTRMAARELAGQIGAEYKEWEIDEEIALARNKIEAADGRELDWEDDDLALQNIQARMRSPLIWFIANTRGHLLLTTSNRNEGDVGYATMDGDTSGGLAPLADVDKVFIRKWLRWAELELGYSSLKYVNEQQPTAELRPPDAGQTDEGDLMPYRILLEIERLAIYRKLSPVQIYRELSDKQLEDPESLKEHIRRFFRMWALNQWKRERLAPSFHFDHFNIDPKTWMRFPILNGAFESDLEDLEYL